MKNCFFFPSTKDGECNERESLHVCQVYFLGRAKNSLAHLAQQKILSLFDMRNIRKIILNHFQWEILSLITSHCHTLNILAEQTLLSVKSQRERANKPNTITKKSLGILLRMQSAIKSSKGYE